MTIARTENAYAYNYGNDEAIKQAEAAGLMPHMVPYWSTSHSGNVCPVCEELEGMPIDEGSGEFSVTWHNRDYTCELPPMHPRCMCAVEYREESDEYTISGNQSDDTAIETTGENEFYSNPMIDDDMVENTEISQEDHPIDSKDETINDLKENRRILNQLIEEGKLSDDWRAQKQQEHMPGTKVRERRIQNDFNNKKTPSSEFDEGVNLDNLLLGKKSDEVIDIKENKSKLVFFSCRSCGKSLQCRYKEI